MYARALCLPAETWAADMLEYVRARERAGFSVSVSKIALLLGAAALAVSIAGDAAAKPQQKKRDDASASASSPIALPPRSNAPVRFFTINQVLAKRDGRPASDDAVRLAAVDPKDTATDAPNAAAGAKGAAGPEPFGLHTFRAPEGLLWVKWRGVASEMDAEAKLIAGCREKPDDCGSP